jgi:hypothetical protein
VGKVPSINRRRPASCIHFAPLCGPGATLFHRTAHTPAVRFLHLLAWGGGRLLLRKGTCTSTASLGGGPEMDKQFRSDFSAGPGPWLSALSVSHSRSVLCGAFVWAHRALTS